MVNLTCFFVQAGLFDHSWSNLEYGLLQQGGQVNTRPSPCPPASLPLCLPASPFENLSFYPVRASCASNAKFNSEIKRGRAQSVSGFEFISEDVFIG